MLDFGRWLYGGNVETKPHLVLVLYNRPPVFVWASFLLSLKSGGYNTEES